MYEKVLAHLPSCPRGRDRSSVEGWLGVGLGTYNTFAQAISDYNHNWVESELVTAGEWVNQAADGNANGAPSLANAA